MVFGFSNFKINTHKIKVPTICEFSLNDTLARKPMT